MAKILEFIQARARLIGTILWVTLFALGLAKTIWEREWVIAVFCALFLGIGIVRLTRTLRGSTPHPDSR